MGIEQMQQFKTKPKERRDRSNAYLASWLASKRTSGPYEARCSPARRSVASPDEGGEHRDGDPGIFIGGRLGGRTVCRVGKGGGSSRVARPRARDDDAGVEVLRGEPAEELLSESECLSEGREVSLAMVGLRVCCVGGELEFWVTSMGW